MLDWPNALAITAVCALLAFYAWLNRRPAITDEHLQKLLLLVADLKALVDRRDPG